MEIPIGGGADQVLTKVSNNDYDVDWGTPAGTGDMTKAEYDPNAEGYILDDFLTLDGQRTMFGAVQVQIDGAAIVCTSPTTGEVLTLDPGHILHVVPGDSPQGALLYVNGGGDWYVHDVATGVEFPITDFANGRVAGLIELDNYLPLVGGAMLGELYLAQDPINPTEAANKRYVDTHLLLDGTRPMIGDLVLANSTPTNGLHATSKDYVDSLVTNTPFLIGLIDAATGDCRFTPESGYTNGPLPIPGIEGEYVICNNPGTIPAGPAAGISMIKGDWLYDTGTIWLLLDVGAVPGGQVFAADVIVNPTVFGEADVQTVLEYIEAHLIDLPPGWVWRGVWNNVTAYDINNLVSHSFGVWLADQANTNSEPGVETNGDWHVIFTLPPLPPGTGDMTKAEYDPNAEGLSFSTVLALRGGVMTGRLTLVADPAPGNDLDAVTKQYVDSLANPIPTGGGTGQVLAKASPINHDLRWQDPTPMGGTDGQVLTKLGAPDFSVEWRDAGGGIVDDANLFTQRGNFTGNANTINLSGSYRCLNATNMPPGTPGSSGTQWILNHFGTASLSAGPIIQEAFELRPGTDGGVYQPISRWIRQQAGIWAQVPLTSDIVSMLLPYALIANTVLINGSNAMTARLTLANLAPINPTHATTKQYVDALVTGSKQLIGVIDASTGLCLYTAASGHPNGVLVAASVAGSNHFVVCDAAGTIPGGPANGQAMLVGDTLVSDGNQWVFIAVPHTAVTASQVAVIPSIFGANNTQAVLEILAFMFQDYALLTGCIFTGPVLGRNPTSAQEFATKDYVDTATATNDPNNAFIGRGFLNDPNTALLPGVYWRQGVHVNLPANAGLSNSPVVLNTFRGATTSNYIV